MTRGDLVIARAVGTMASKARPCLIVQSGLALPARSRVTMCPLTSTLGGRDLVRVPIAPTEENGLHAASEIEIDLIGYVDVETIEKTIGQAGRATMALVDAALRRWLDL